MSSPRFQKPREPASLKEAVAELVKACGGIARASKATRVSQSTIARYTDPASDDVHMPVDVVRALELAAKDPIVTRFLAAEAHALLVDLPKGDTANYAQHLASIGRETGKLYAEAAEALGHNKISRPQAARVMREALKTAAALAALISDLRRTP